MNNDSKYKMVTFRRLLLAKHLYLHGLHHSNKRNALDKMIAIHNFHNSIEITLRAILLNYNIRTEKTLNIEFEVLLNEIDNFKDFKESGLKLPHRQQIRTLNQVRNHVQHQAIEPEESTMEEWRVFTRDFLNQVFHDYFKLDFIDLTSVDLIQDNIIKKLLRMAHDSLKKNDSTRGLILSKLTFDLSFKDLQRLSPDKTYWYDLNRLPAFKHDKVTEDIIEYLKELEERVIDHEHLLTLITAGINLMDYKRFLDMTPTIVLNFSGDLFQIKFRDLKILVDAQPAYWAHDFVIHTIIHWQTLGLKPSISEKNIAIQEIIDSNGANLNSYSEP